MKQRISDLILATAHERPDGPAISHGKHCLAYGELGQLIDLASKGLLETGLRRGDRVAVYLEKRSEAVIALFGTAAAGGAFVPCNPILKAAQVRHILRDCDVRVLVTSKSRLQVLKDILPDCPSLLTLVVVDGDSTGEEDLAPGSSACLTWQGLLDLGEGSTRSPFPVLETDIASILYTSGSTGRPKGVVLSHRNMLTGAMSVSEYLENSPDDRILAVLPLSFDAGLSQLTTAFNVGAKAVLLNYLMPGDVVRACAEERITGLTCVPPLWIQLAEQDWPTTAAENLRYFANTGGRMPRPTLTKLRQALPWAKPYLMYGLTEAFRSTYLHPSEIDRRPDSIGKAVPGVEVLVVRGDGTPCDVGEVGELVHRGPFVSMGYWNDADATGKRFRPPPGQLAGICTSEVAVWSGDYVRADEEGFLYFVGRRDEMIKTSGYRVSPTELEELIYGTGLVGEVVALGVPHDVLGQSIIAIATPPDQGGLDQQALMTACREKLPTFMVPGRIIEMETLPRNANGKIDRTRLAAEAQALVEEQAEQATRVRAR